MIAALARPDDAGNPLDSVADFLANQDWIYNRPQPDELIVSVTGRQGTYRLAFVWQEEFGALQFFCECDLSLSADRQDIASRALRAINQRLWLGHFDVVGGNGVPTFRHTSLFRGWAGASSAEHVEDLVEIGLAECERHYNIFTMLAGSDPLDDHALELALADEAGIA